MIYDISYKTLIDPKLLRIRFNKIDGIIRIYDGTKHLTLFGWEKYEAVFNSIRDRNSQKKWHHIYFFLLSCKNQSWFLWLFTYSKKNDFV